MAGSVIAMTPVLKPAIEQALHPDMSFSAALNHYVVGANLAQTQNLNQTAAYTMGRSLSEPATHTRQVGRPRNQEASADKLLTRNTAVRVQFSPCLSYF